ncbi:GNAT family N-acetyltransferase [Treponema sp.]|uniref:GNAT family N-acetyltransferase n=1 Tax=Treponema sp. TaxID=166 RepID=UPI00388D2188
MHIKKLKGNRIYLSPMTPEDALRYTEFLNDLEVTRGLVMSGANVTVDGERSWLSTQSSSNQDYSIIDLASEKLIGSVGLDSIDSLNATAELGIVIGDKDYWNKGYGAEAITLILDYGFRRLNLHSVFLHVYSFNERAVHCYERIGFKKAGVLRQQVQRGGKFYDRYIMDILADEFYEMHPEFDRTIL